MFGALVLSVGSAGCTSSSVIAAESLRASEYLEAAALEDRRDAELVLIRAVGVRLERERRNGRWWLIVDLAFEGPAHRVRGVAEALKYRFYYEAPALISIDDVHSRPVRLDAALYDQRKRTTLVQFSREVFFESLGAERFRAVQPYGIAVRNLPTREDLTIRLHAEAIRDRLGSIMAEYAHVEVDADRYRFLLRDAILLAE